MARMSKAALMRHSKRSTTEAGKAMDDAKLAKRVYPADMTEEQAAVWMKSPNRYDVEGIDAPPGTANVEFEKQPKQKSSAKTGRKPASKAKPASTRPNPKASAKPKTASKPKTIAKPKQRRYTSRPPRKGSRADLYPEQTARDAVRSNRNTDHLVEEDARAYLEDCEYDEISKNSRWKYDKRALADEIAAKKWSDLNTYGFARKRSARNARRSRTRRRTRTEKRTGRGRIFGRKK